MNITPAIITPYFLFPIATCVSFSFTFWLESSLSQCQKLCTLDAYIQHSEFVPARNVQNYVFLKMFKPLGYH